MKMAPPKSGTIKTTMPIKPVSPVKPVKPGKDKPKIDFGGGPKPTPKMPGIRGMAKGGSASKGKK